MNKKSKGDSSWGIAALQVQEGTRDISFNKGAWQGHEV